MSKITREALLHIPRSNYCYGYDENTLHIRLRAKKGEVKSAFLSCLLYTSDAADE